MSSMSTTTASHLSRADDLFRLPTDLKPTRYHLVIQTDLKNLNFRGAVVINLAVEVETSRIVLNASELKLEKTSLVVQLNDSVEKWPIVSTTYDEVYERLTYKLKDPLPVDAKATLIIRFSGDLTESRAGYYRSTWAHDGMVEHYSVTKFEAISARKAFPCWDEPSFKATFDVTMISAPDTVNLSNMPASADVVVGTEAGALDAFTPEVVDILAIGNAQKFRITTFQTTPLMSTYIVAYANGPFKFIESSVAMPLSGKTIPLRVYVTSDLIHQAQYVLDVTAASLPVYEQIFNVEYPLPKLDTLLAHDFEGAMEHWGLITGAAQVLLIDVERSTQREKMFGFQVQCHEIAHMWFGNITTMKWWDTLYLNEGFATLMGELIVPERIHPEWRAGSEFVVVHLNRALDLDSKLSSHPIEVECPDANRINEIFDSLSYSKAGSVLRMLSNYVGQDKFLEGVSIYLKAHLFGNSVTHDLWEGISAATGIDIADLMDDWITKVGYPVLTVTENVDGIHVRQDRFLGTGPADPKDNETIWNVPLNLLSVEHGIASVDREIVLREREATYVVDTTKPFKFNTGNKGVYRVLYTPERLVKIATEAAQQHSIFSLDDKTGLLQDVFALSKAGFLTPSSSLTVVDLWRSEQEYLVWGSIAAGLEDLTSIWWEDAKVVDNLKRFQRTLFVPLVEKLGYEYSENDSGDRILLRTLAITQAAAAEDEGVLQVLKGKFKKMLETGNKSEIPTELQQVTYAVAVKFGGRIEYDTVVKIFEERKMPSEEKAATFAMGASQDLGIIHETTEFIVNKARDQDLVHLFVALSANFVARRAATQTLMQNYDTFYNRYKDQLGLGVLISACLKYYSSQTDYQSIEAYFKAKDTSKYNQALAQSLESIKARSAYVERSTADILDWFHKNKL